MPRGLLCLIVKKGFASVYLAVSLVIVSFSMSQSAKLYCELVDTSPDGTYAGEREQAD